MTAPSLSLNSFLALLEHAQPSRARATFMPAHQLANQCILLDLAERVLIAVGGEAWGIELGPIYLFVVSIRVISKRGTTVLASKQPSALGTETYIKHSVLVDKVPAP